MATEKTQAEILSDLAATFRDDLPAPGLDINDHRAQLENIAASIKYAADLRPLATTYSTPSAPTIQFDRPAGRKYTDLLQPTSAIGISFEGTEDTVVELRIDPNSQTITWDASAISKTVYGASELNLVNGSINIVTAWNNDEGIFLKLYDTILIPDTTAPSWTTNSVTNVGDTTALYSAEINEDGNVYWYVSGSATPPSKTDLQAGTGAVDFGSLTMTANTANTANVTGLTAESTYYVHAYAVDGSGNESVIQTSASFTTTATAALTLDTDYNAANNASITTVGGSVSQVINDGTNTNDAVQATSSLQPSHDDVNDLFLFDETAQQNLIAGNPASQQFQIGDSFSIVISALTCSAGGYIYNRIDPSTGEGFRILISEANGYLYFDMRDSVNTFQVIGDRGGAGYVDSVSRSFIFSNESGVLKMYNENNVIINSIDASALGNISYTNSTIRIGQQEGVTNQIQAFDGSIGRIKVFTGRALNETERNTELGI